MKWLEIHFLRALEYISTIPLKDVLVFIKNTEDIKRQIVAIKI